MPACCVLVAAAVGAVIAAAVISVAGSRPPGRERYGPPPGMSRAVSHYELDSRGWPQWPKEFEGSSAGAMGAFIQRSA